MAKINLDRLLKQRSALRKPVFWPKCETCCKQIKFSVNNAPPMTDSSCVASLL